MKRHAALLFLLCLAVYGVFTHGGIRSPDSEVAFRTAESLAFRGTFAVEGYLDQWPGFGFAEGRDGRLYSRYQPLQPILLVPFVRVADWLTRCDGVRRLLRPVPGSHYVTWDPGVVQGRPPADPRPHLLRFLVLPFTILVSAAQVAVFYLLVLKLTGDTKAAWLCSIAFAFCTLNLTYAGTLFKEPLIGLFVLSAFLLLVEKTRLPDTTPGRGEGRLLLSGFLAGLAIATHLLALPFVPFLAFMAAAAGYKKGRWAGSARTVAIWGLGVLPVLAFLAWYNFDRFGSVLDTGFRASAAEMQEQRFQSPLVGVSGLLFGAGKGLLFYCPIAVIGAFLWPRFHRQRPVVSAVCAALVLVRLLFVGSFRDWHGGFCLGPRYLVNVTPFLLLPLAFWIRDVLQDRDPARLRALFLAAWVCLSEQMYLAMGEIFAYLYQVKWNGLRAGVDVFKDDQLYFNWRLSPLLYLNEGIRGPFLLKKIPLSNGVLLGILCAAAFLLLLWLLPGVLPTGRQPGDETA